MTFLLPELRVLTGLADGRRLVDIGEEMHIGQPSVSKLLRSAELKARVALVERRGRRLALTATGRTIAAEARVVLGRLGQIDALLEDVRTGRGGLLRLVATNAPANYVLPEVIVAFQRAFPRAELALRVVTENEITRDLEGDGFDLGIAPRSAVHAGLLAEELYEEPITFFTSSTSSLADEVTWDRVKRHQFVGSFSDSTWTYLLKHLARQGFLAGPRINIRGVEGAKRLTEAGGGVGLAFHSALRRDFDEKRLRPLKIQGLTLSQAYVVVRRRDVHLLPIAAAFESLLRSLTPRSS
jgi:DNA-binding transcriptional LysR family regulator